MSANSEKAVAMFGEGFNCAQSVLASCGGPLGLPRETALRVAGTFGGGMGLMGETCGAVTGALMTIGLKYAKTSPGAGADGDAAKKKGYELARQFAARFKERNKTITCRDLIGYDLTTPQGMTEASASGVLKTVCPKLVRDAAEIVEQLLAEANEADSIRQTVQEKYAAVAISDLSSRHQGVKAVAQAFGYSEGDLASIPAEANMGLSCGNPIALASLKPGDVVVDLGSGGGLDVFLASEKVGPTGKAIGIDMTPSMIDRARKAAAKGVKGKPYANVEFHLATIDKLPLPDGSVDCVISNCVINLAPDKKAVFREIARVLKPGGRLAVSDIALKKPLPAELAQDVTAYVGCIAGAIAIEDYRQGLIEAGFAEVAVVDSGKDLNAYAKAENQSACCSPAMETVAEETSCCSTPREKLTPKTSCCGTSPKATASSCCGSTPKSESRGGPALHNRMTDLLKRYNVNDFAASVKVYALKPSAARMT